MKLILNYINPPIPIRGFDWVCYQDGCEDGLHGYGETPEAALEKWQEYHSETEDK